VVFEIQESLTNTQSVSSSKF